MATILVALHIIVSLFLIFIVLIQGGKGAELGAAFGGGASQTIFGGRGAATFLNKLTTVIAIVFMFTSLLLAIVSVRSTSVVGGSEPAKAVPAQQQAPVPGTEGQLPATGSPFPPMPAQPAPATEQPAK